MQRTLIASVILMSLSACDGGILSKDTITIKGTDNTTEDLIITSSTTQNSNNSISDDSASATSDGGETTAGNSNTSSNDSNNSNSNSSDSSTISSSNDNSDNEIDAGGGKYDYDYDDYFNDADGGKYDDQQSGDTDEEVNHVDDDAASSTSDGGETNDDAASSSSDGGESTDGNENNNADTGTDTTGTGDNFTSENVGGTILRTSSLSTVAQQNICTTASAQENFSDMRIGDFILHNNAWRPWRAFPGYEWEQCIYSNTNGAIVGWNYDWGPGQTGINGATQASGDYYVRSYPELIYGVKDEYRTSAPKSVTGFPVELSQLPNISIDYAYNGPQYGDPREVDASNNPRFPNGTTISGERNIAIESFFYNKDSVGQCSEGIVTRTGGSNHVYEIMVWLDAGAERLPAGPSDFVTDLNIRGDDYKVYTKAADPRYIAFVAQNPQTSGTIYWNDFVDWAKGNAHQVQSQFGARSNSIQIQDDWCVANIIVGTEIFWGAGNLDIYNWTITQSQ